MNLNDIADVSDLDSNLVKGQNVLLRVSFDAFDSQGNIKDSVRIEAAERTIRILKQKGAKNIILLTYAGRPDKNAEKIGENAKFSGKLYDKRFSVRPAADFLHGLLKERVHFVSALDDYGNFHENASDYLAHARDYMEKNVDYSGVVLLDNLRFWEGENNGDKPIGKEFAQLIATLGTIYVQDGFAQAHRESNATISEITRHTKINVLGMHTRSEIQYLSRVFDNLLKEKRNPFVFILGGKKIETKPGIVSKIDIVNKLMKNMKTGDKILIGGAMAYPFMIAEKYLSDVRQGKEKIIDILPEEIVSVVGNSYIEWDQIHDQIMIAGKTLLNAEKRREEGSDISVKLPVDHCVMGNSPRYAEQLGKDMVACDIGPKTLDIWQNEIKNAHTILLIGPLGIYKNKVFSECSRRFVESIAERTKDNVTTIAAGGDTAEMVRTFGCSDKFSLVSIGGGATLEFLLHGHLLSLKLLDTREKIKAMVPLSQAE